MAHVPERTCVGCRGRAAKVGLIRLVRTPDGAVAVDPTRSGSTPGRGAYLHPARPCVEAGLRRSGLARALRTGVPPEELVRLMEEIERRLD